MRVIICTGIGRLHLVQSAQWLKRAGVDVSVIQGWVPHLSDKWLSLIGRAIKYQNFAHSMKKRCPVELEGRIKCCTSAEFLYQVLVRISEHSHGLVSSSKISRFSCCYYGWLSKRFLYGAQIFHVRSSVGQGGAIECAKQRGMKVLVDHSAAHSAYTDRMLRSECEKYGFTNTMTPTDPFWSLILKDCDDADLLLVNSDFVKDTFVANGYPLQKIRVAYLGVRPDFFALKTNYRTVFFEVEGEKENSSPIELLFTGNFGILKGCMYLLEAMKILSELGVKYRLTVVGSSSDRSILMEAYEEIKSNINFTGHLPQDELKKFFMDSDIYIFPSLAEGCASSGLEAMAAGLCVVSTAESGLPITDNETGCVVPAKDARSIADKIIWLMRNPTKMERMGRAATRLIQDKYTWEKYAENVKNVYKELEEMNISTNS